MLARALEGLAHHSLVGLNCSSFPKEDPCRLLVSDTLSLSSGFLLLSPLAFSFCPYLCLFYSHFILSLSLSLSVPWTLLLRNWSRDPQSFGDWRRLVWCTFFFFVVESFGIKQLVQVPDRPPSGFAMLVEASLCSRHKLWGCSIENKSLPSRGLQSSRKRQTANE